MVKLTYVGSDLCSSVKDCFVDDILVDDLLRKKVDSIGVGIVFRCFLTSHEHIALILINGMVLLTATSLD